MLVTEFLQYIGGCVTNINLSYGLPISLFLAGLVGGATHCVIMCGPFVLSQSGDIKKMRGVLLLPYHLGRITTYIAMAMILSSVLNMAFLFLPIRGFVIAPILILAGFLFLVNAFPSLSKLFPWLVRAIANIKSIIPYPIIIKGFNSLSKNGNIFKKYLMGILLGFMPCGIIVSALMVASTAPNILSAGAAMGAFGLGTMPSLVILAFGGKSLAVKFPNGVKSFSKYAMVISSVWLFTIAGLLLI